MRITDFLKAVADALKASTLFMDVRIQLDPYDLEDVTHESFQPPAARVLFTTAKPICRADGSMDMDCTLSIAIICKRHGRPDPAFASADIAALNLALATCQIIQNDPYFGQGKVKAAVIEDLKVTASEKANGKGLSICVVMFRSRLLEVVTERPEIGEAIGTQLPGPDLRFSPELEEIIDFEGDNNEL